MPLEQERLILHIDDDEDDRMLVREAIEKIDSQIVLEQASGGLEGIHLLREAKRTGHLPHLIILDLNMPGMDGKEVLLEIKKDPDLARVPLVLFTTSSSELDRLFAYKQEVEMITKPPNSAALIRAVNRMLEKCD